MKNHIAFLMFFAGLLCVLPGHAQQDRVAWLTFGTLEDSLQLRPKKVFLDFYADWCEYCKKMDRVAFRDPTIVDLLNAEYHAVRMDVETRDTIAFGGREYTNPEFGKSRSPVHEIPRLLASREGMPFALPAIVILDEQFRVQARYFRYLPPEELLAILKGSSP